MTSLFRHAAAPAALLAALGLVVSPAAAAELPLPAGAAAQVITGAPGSYDGWGRRHHRHRDGIDAGDVIAGVAVIGLIAAIAGAADSNNRRERVEERYPEPQYRRDERPARTRSYTTERGIDNAVDLCVEQVERGSERVDSVDNAGRTADGWRVAGVLDNGEAWSCWIDNDGRVRSVDFGARVSASDGQLSDEAYASARAAQGAAAPVDGDLRPAYPGGPLPGEDGYDEAVQLSAR